MDNENKIYIGDGAYASFDGYAIEVYTSDGYDEANRVYLEPDVMKVLVEFAKGKGVIDG